MNLNKSTQRETWIDVSKTILIYFMILGHCGLPQYNIWFYSFHMPAFFIISGYLYKPHSLLKTMKNLFIPVIIFSIINLLFQIFLSIISGNLGILDSYKNCWLSYFMKGNYKSLFPGVWFIMVLFWGRCLMGDLKIIPQFKNRDLFLIIICIVITTILPNISTNYREMQDLHIIKTIACLPFLIIGKYFRCHNIFFNQKQFWILSILFIVYIVLTIYNGNIDLYSSIYGRNTLVMYINATLSSLVLFNMCKHIHFCRSYFELCSKGTLLIMGMHLIILYVLKYIIHKIGIEYTFICGMTLSFITLIICIPLIWISLKKMPWIIGK